MRKERLICRRSTGRASLIAAVSLICAVGLAPAHRAMAQPVGTIKIVVPLPPGGAGDIVARLLAEPVGHVAGQTVVTENRPGAGSIIGTETVARAAPDGRTLLINAPYMLIAPHVKKV